MNSEKLQKKKYNDLSLIIKHLDESLVKLLPKKFLDFVQSSRVPDWESEIDPSIPINEQELSSETRGLLSALCLTYWAESETSRRDMAESLFHNEQKYNGQPETPMTEADYQDILKECDHWNEMFGPIPFWEESRCPKAYFDPDGIQREPDFLKPSKPKDDGKEFWTICTKEEAALILKDESLQETRIKGYGHSFADNEEEADLYLHKCKYYGEAVELIMREVNEWEILVYETEGYDMGYGTEGEDTDYHVEPVPPEIIIVEDGHFAGVVDTSSFGSYTQPKKYGSSVHAALIKNWNDKPMFYRGSSYRFSGDDHESWSSTSYNLKKKTC